MKAVEIRKIGNFDGLKLVSRSVPDIGPREVLIRIRATSLNYRDLLVPLGNFPLPGNYIGRVPLSDGAGEVTSVGCDVKRFRIGDRVVANALPDFIGGQVDASHIKRNLGFDVDGMLVEFAALDESALALVPEYMSYAEAASLPCAALSAWVSLTGGNRAIAAGDTVLVQGSGGVSIFALQLAKLFGARVIATTSAHRKACGR